MKRLHPLVAAAGIALGVIAGVSAAPAAPKPVTIALPPQNVAFRDAPGVEIARKDCLVCHSAEYVTTQPALSKTAWTNEITKMRAAYGASIPDADVDALIAYLVAQNPAAEKK